MAARGDPPDIDDIAEWAEAVLGEEDDPEPEAPRPHGSEMRWLQSTVSQDDPS
ncbi:hypothetical protein [Actinomadura sp. 21ATH]|uniref:hypothetical protein n=1 Tax=Actinomadura sp. 21ATH TaxID=1735444 RepID=UPI0035C16DE0